MIKIFTAVSILQLVNYKKNQPLLPCLFCSRVHRHVVFIQLGGVKCSYFLYPVVYLELNYYSERQLCNIDLILSHKTS
jgi:hypothetical protein